MALTREERLRAAEERSKHNIEHKDQGGFQGKQALDFAKIGGWKKELIYKPKAGMNHIDIIPYIVTTDKHPNHVRPGYPDYLLDIYVHRFVGASKSTFLCLQQMYGKPCPICEERERMKNDPTLPEDEYKKLFPKRRTIYNVINTELPEREQKVMLFEEVYSWFEGAMLEVVKLKNEYTFWDIEEGKTIEFMLTEKKTPMGTNNTYGQFFFDKRPAYKENVYDEAFKLDDLLVIPTYEEVRNAFLSVDEEPESAESSRREPEQSSRRRDPEPEERPSRRADPVAETMQGDTLPEGFEDRGQSRRRERQTEPAENPCPFGHRFGIDNDQFGREGHCTKCDQKIWNACADEKDRLEGK
jgi:hypothetical protein